VHYSKKSSSRKVEYRSADVHFHLLSSDLAKDRYKKHGRDGCVWLSGHEGSRV